MNWWRLVNLTLATYCLTSGLTNWLLNGLYAPMAFLGLFTAYSISALMTGVLILFFDHMQPKTALAFIFLWHSLSNLLTLPGEMLSGSGFISVYTGFQFSMLFIGTTWIVFVNGLPKFKPSSLYMLMAVVLIFAGLGDSYHMFSSVLAFSLLPVRR